jgi:DNA-binding transcriptional LysR family regulator
VTVRVAVSDYLGKELLAPVLRDTVGAHAAASPAPRFAITTAHSADAVRLLELGEVDAAIISTASPPPGLDDHLLFEQPLRWVAARRDPAAPIAARLATEPVLRLAPGSLGRAMLDGWLERQGIRPASTIEVPSVSLLVAYAATGCGVGLAPALPLLDVDPALVVVEDADLPPLAVRLVLRPNYPMGLAMAVVMERVKARGAELARQLTRPAAGTAASGPNARRGKPRGSRRP